MTRWARIPKIKIKPPVIHGFSMIFQCFCWMHYIRGIELGGDWILRGQFYAFEKTPASFILEKSWLNPWSSVPEAYTPEQSSGPWKKICQLRGLEKKTTWNKKSIFLVKISILSQCPVRQADHWNKSPWNCWWNKSLLQNNGRLDSQKNGFH